MGTSNSKDSNTAEMINNVLKDYDIIQRVPDQNVLYLHHKITEEEFLLREFNYTDKKACNEMVDRLNRLKIKLTGNKHVVQLKDHALSWEDGYCSRFFKVFALFQYPQRTLDDESSQRRQQNRKFQQTEIWSILASCILGFAHLQKKGIEHSCIKSSSILVSQNGNIKISHPFVNAQQSLYETALARRSTPHLYMSPELCQALSEELITPNVNEYKSDTWSLGMVMLEIGLLQYQDSCYREEYSRLNDKVLQYKLNCFQETYSEELRIMLDLMLNKNQKIRPDWIEMEQHVISGDQSNLNSNNSSRRSIFFYNQALDSAQTDTANILPSYKIQSRNKVPPPIIVNEQPTHKDQPPPSFPVYSNHNFKAQKTQSHIIHLNPNPFAKQNQPRQILRSYVTQVYPQQTHHPEHQAINQHSHLQKNYNPVQPRQMINQYHQPHHHVQRNHHPIHSHQQMEAHFTPYPFYIHRTLTDQGKQFETKIYPSMVSDITFSRPIKNMYPPTSYLTKTRADQNYRKTKKDDLPSSPSIQLHISQECEKQFDNPKLQYVEEVYSMGSRYIGFKLNGHRHGEGKFFYQDGGLYDGEWKNNKMDGFGKLYYQSGTLAYEGSWKEDQFYGFGILLNEQSEPLETGFDFTNFDNIGEYWTKYEGGFLNDLKNGSGILFFSNGQRFEGNFISDVIQGKGIFYCLNGTAISGFWKDNQKLE